MKASLAQRIDCQVKCDRSIQIGATKREIVVKTTTTTTRKAAVVTSIWKGAKRCSRTVSLNRSRIQKAEPIPKSRTVLLLLTEHLQRNPSNEKGKGRPLPAQGTPLAKLSKLRLSRIRSPETSSRTCVESMLCKVHPELYITPLTQPIKNAPDLYHFKRLGMLFCLEDGGLWSGGVIWSCGLDWWW